MYFKMALRNVKKSFKDYSIYFLTLTFAVSIFYSFNSINSQKAMLEIVSSEVGYIDVLEQVLSLVSVFVALILGSLILYGNNFLIKKRKKELGIYKILGISNKKIAKILFIETICVGMLALITGIVLGIGLGQGLSVFTLKLFSVDMSAYTFGISGSGIVKSIIYFSMIFIVVMGFNTLSISRYKVIDLLYSSKKSQGTNIRDVDKSVGVFIVSIGVLGSAYWLIKKVGLNPEHLLFWVATLLGIVGTYGYFSSLTGFIMAVLTQSQKLYFRELNMFTIRQLNSKIHTHVVSMTVICLMLFLTIGGLSTGLSFKHTLEQGLEQTTPYDASVTTYAYEEEMISIEEAFSKLGVSFEEGEEHAIYNVYTSKLVLGDLDNTIGKELYNMRVDLIPLSEFNTNRVLMKQSEVILAQDEVLLTSNNKQVVRALEEVLNQKQTINIEGNSYTINNKEVLEVSLYTAGFTDNFCTVIVPDYVVEQRVPYITTMNINYGADNRTASETKFMELFEGYRQGSYKGEKIDYDDVGFMNGYTKNQIYVQNQGMTTVILYVGIYLGIVFLISSAAVLALQQLAEASDSIPRYDSLIKIGASKKMINKAIMIQTSIYFLLPLSLAFVHALVGISVANEFLSLFGKPDIGVSSLMTLGILVVVYGGYYYITYVGYKNVVDHKGM